MDLWQIRIMEENPTARLITDDEMEIIKRDIIDHLV